MTNGMQYVNQPDPQISETVETGAFKNEKDAHQLGIQETDPEG